MGLFELMVIFLALGFLILGAYRGFSVIILAPVAALGAVVLTNAASTAPAFSGVYLEAMVGFLRSYFPVFLLGAVFGKLFEISGFSNSVADLVVRVLGQKRVIPATVAICALLTYGGISLFVVVFAVYPLAAAMFRDAGVPKRLLPATIALGAFTFSMDALPGSPQIQNIIPTTFFGTTTWAAPALGSAGALMIAVIGLGYLEYRRHRLRHEGYGDAHLNEPERLEDSPRPPAWMAMLPLLVVAGANLMLTQVIPRFYGPEATVHLEGMKSPISIPTASVVGVWAVEGALLCGCLLTALLAFRKVVTTVKSATSVAASGAILAATNTAAEFGFGAVIAALPGFVLIREGLRSISDPLIHEAVTITSLAAATGSGSGGLSIALGTLGDEFLARGQAAGIPPEVLHRIASMACGGLDTLPHNGAVITLLAVTGLTHRQSYPDIFAITCTKTAVVFCAIGLYYAFNLV